MSLLTCLVRKDLLGMKIYDNDEGGGSASGIGFHPLSASLNMSRDIYMLLLCCML